MKVAAILYHKNIQNLYKEEWIEQGINSIKNQTFQDFIIYELNYGDEKLNLSKKYNLGKKTKFFEHKLNNHAEAMNFLFEECLKNKIDIAVNNNIDDVSDVLRYEKQVELVKSGYDIVSSNFEYLNEDLHNSLQLNGKKMIMNNLIISQELQKEHNVICHPSVCYSRKFIENNKYIPGEIPKEDLRLWQRTINNYKFYICEEIFIKYRIHSSQITKQEEEKKIQYQEQNLLTEFLVRRPPQITDVYCICGEKKDKVKYNFCQKCNRLY